MKPKDLQELLKRVNENYERYTCTMQQQDIDRCPHNANPQAGICPAARDTFLIMWKEMLEGLGNGK